MYCLFYPKIIKKNKSNNPFPFLHFLFFWTVSLTYIETQLNWIDTINQIFEPLCLFSKKKISKKKQFFLCILYSKMIQCLTLYIWKCDPFLEYLTSWNFSPQWDLSFPYLEFCCLSSFEWVFEVKSGSTDYTVKHTMLLTLYYFPKVFFWVKKWK